MRIVIRIVLAFAVVLSIAPGVSARSALRDQVERYVSSHQQAIVGELVDLLSIPNVAADRDNIRKNAARLEAMLAKRGLTARLLETDGHPLVYGELRVPGATRTLLLYAHYDGQPVHPPDWKQQTPFTPILRDGRLEDGGRELDGLAARKTFEPDWRVYARSASDDKSPIVALLTALDALKASGLTPTSNLRIVLDGEEEAGSASLVPAIARYRDRLTADAMLILDGPVHPSQKPTLVFGARGIVNIELTVYGPKMALHSGHYGNWVANPAMRLAQLLATFKDDKGRVQVDGFYDGLTPLTPQEQAMLDAVPDSADGLMTLFGIAAPEDAGRSLQASLQRPSFNIRGLSSAFVGAGARTIIPDRAIAAIDVRLVKETPAAQMIEKVRAHLTKQGYHVVSADPDAATRAEHAKIVKLVVGAGGTNAYRTSPLLPISKDLTSALTQVFGEPPVQIRTSGGTVPIAPFIEALGFPAISVPIVNFDNNQHGENENLRLGHLWRGIVTFAAILQMPSQTGTAPTAALQTGAAQTGAAQTGAAQTGAAQTGAAQTGAAQAGAWQPARGRLATRWAAEVTPDKVLPEYPRPQLVRQRWLNLNGLWEYAIRPRGDAQPSQWDGQILVPFAAESALSGVMKEVGSANRLWYRRTFTPRDAWKGQRLLLHFGAVDWHSTVFVNGKQVGEHKGGYDPFTFDITSAIKAGGPNELVVSVWDPTDEGEQPRGKQVRRPRSIWYTAVTGIWQTVWLEPVPQQYIERLRITPDPDRDRVQFEVARGGVSGSGGDAPAGSAARAQTLDIVIKGEGGKTVAERRGLAADKPVDIPLAKATRWSPTTPFLYQVEVALREGDKPVDRVGSYFGMRTIAVKKDAQGVNRLFLNGQPLFQMGPLDQGWWPDGLYTAPTDAALKYDLDVTKQLGFNMVRKHVKVEPARWYYWCDTLGLLVWQDMPSAFAPAKDTVPAGAPAPTQAAEGHAQVERELIAMMDALSNHPSIVMWVPFNEGWGQYDTPRIAKLVKAKDPTRIVNETSGWDNHDSGEVRDVHEYPGPSMPPLEDDRAAVLGEFGGLGLVVDDHLWQKDANWGYRSYKTRAELNDQYAARVSALRPLIGHGLAAAIYTQTTDVEIEVNGFMTYDRALIKLDADRVRALHESLYRPPSPTQVVLPISQAAAHAWRYTTTAPAADWFEPSFADASWTQAQGPFGKSGAPLSEVRTPWTSPDIWLRRSFEIARVPEGALYLLIRHDEDATVYVNGQKIAEVPGTTSHYAPVEVSATLRGALKTGANVIAVHCKQTKGDQFIDVGILAHAATP